jgi:hypothetical protein
MGPIFSYNKSPYSIMELPEHSGLNYGAYSLAGCGFTQAKKRGTAGPVLAIPFWGQPVFVFRNYFYAALVTIVHRKIW